MVILELAREQRLHRVSARYEMAGGDMEVFLLNRLGSDPTDLSGSKSVASVSNRDASGKAAIDFDPKGARYVALRWTPKAGSDRSLEVAEVNAFGDVAARNVTAERSA